MEFIVGVVGAAQSRHDGGVGADQLQLGQALDVDGDEASGAVRTESQRNDQIASGAELEAGRIPQRPQAVLLVNGQQPLRRGCRWIRPAFRGAAAGV